jgi:hypothetical protein
MVALRSCRTARTTSSTCSVTMHSSGATSGEVIADQRLIKMAERGEQVTHSNGANSIQSFLGGPQKSSTSRSEERRGTTKSVRFASEVCVISFSLNDPPLEIRGLLSSYAAAERSADPDSSLCLSVCTTRRRGCLKRGKIVRARLVSIELEVVWATLK